LNPIFKNYLRIGELLATALPKTKRIANSGYFQKPQREVIGFHERTSNELMDS
jgi:hypothetical protein